ncbi:unnamed protein product [Didymodactylos carnosus]|uniref:Uncharacterized protein n=1 Tax=Didymodactylos carnosus TaxID=1234261 RepID=A0A815FDQ3_9BILA|nr:unnamed protein product [Didymodactylos carnosus]CAF1317728.1 unnamed protein product [Didymodactylos carnosus]CAF3659065.1 unnamed protein product [Didymodactylos carnosus]CAF4161083.1 unnamed protein product [Didymodactylos carnosus]
MSQITNWRASNTASQRPLLERVDEVDDDVSASRYSTSGTGCMKYFGVKSYLHNFYDRTDQHSESDDSQYRYLTLSRRKKFSIGFISLSIGFLLPRRNIEISSDASSITIDRKALNYNQSLEFCQIIGVFVFALGGFLFIVSLLLPTFFNNYCAAEVDELNHYTDPFKLPLPQNSVTKNIIPVTNTLKSIQPNYRKDESRLTTHGVVPIQSS